MDPISDMISSIKNALAVGYPTVNIPFSNLKFEIAKILKKEGFIKDVEKKGKLKKSILITLKYKQEVPVISELKKISKPGQRIYLTSQKVKPVKGGYGMAIISTSKGLMTDKEARKQKLGGEIICKVW